MPWLALPYALAFDCIIEGRLDILLHAVNTDRTLKKHIAIIALALLSASCDRENIRTLPSEEAFMPFEEIAIKGGANTWSGEFHPFVGATPIDIDGDGMFEIFIGGGHGYDDMLFAYRDHALVNIIEQTGLSDLHATHGANSIDIDNDGDTDLLLARSNGVFLYENQQGMFSARQLPVSLPADATALNIAVGDIDKDGDGDLYISTFIRLAHFRSATFNDPAHARTNIMLRNDDGVFVDITETSNTAALQNTFVSSFIDLDKDGWPDLVVAQNTGQVEFFRNNRDYSFTAMPVSTGWGFWMGIAVGDIDKDGDQDLFFTNSGVSIPPILLEAIGDATDAQPRNYGWLLLRNEGNFKFSDVTSDYQLDGYGFGWGPTLEDLTLDGQLELLVAQNYIAWFVHDISKLPGKSFVQRQSAFYHVPALGVENPAFSQAPLIVDMNHDYRPDLFWVDMEGVGRAFINRSTNNFITLLFPDTAVSIGATAFVRTTDGEKSIVRELHNNTGFSVDHWPALTFGLGQKNAVAQVVVQWPDGTRQTMQNPSINTAIHIRK